MNRGTEARATEWMIRRDAGLSVAEERDFKRWLKSDPRNRVALRVAERRWSALDILADLRPAFDGEPDPDLLIRADQISRLRLTRRAASQKPPTVFEEFPGRRRFPGTGVPAPGRNRFKETQSRRSGL